MKNFLKKRSLAIQLAIVFLVVVLVSIALIMEAIELDTAIAIYAVLIAIAVLLISINEIRNRLRPWVSVATIDQTTASAPNTLKYHFKILNTGPVPANKVIFNVRWFVQKNNTWEEIQKPGIAPFTSTSQTLFPNQGIQHIAVVTNLKTATYDTKVTFVIEYRGLWSRYTTTTTHRFDHINKVWTPDEPQDYT
jgi:hypothetical protein